MTDHEWRWANLNDEQFNLLREGEQTLGADILLAYQQAGPSSVSETMFSRSGLQVAPLNESQLECLQGLEKNMQAVVIAYRQAKP